MQQEFPKWLTDLISQNRHIFNESTVPEMMRLTKLYAKQFKLTKQLYGIRAVGAVYDLLDSSIKRLLLESNVSISCKQGCAFCCHINVEVSKDEAAYISAYCKKANIKISKSHLKEQLKTPAMEQPFSRASACVFLKNNLCSIYEARPAACRNHMVTTDPRLCDAAKYKHGAATVFFAEAAPVMWGLYDGSETGRMAEMLLPYSK